MRYIALVLVCLVITACGKNGPNGEPWPASVVAINAVSDTELSTLHSLIHDLNERAGKTVIDEVNQDLAYTIEIVKVDGATWKEGQAGFATRDGEHCVIELKATLFSSLKQFLESVFLHEVGHCAGLTHTTEGRAIMNPITQSFASYTPDILSGYMSSLFSAAGL